MQRHMMRELSVTHPGAQKRTSDHMQSFKAIFAGTWRLIYAKWTVVVFLSWAMALVITRVFAVT